MTKPFLKPVHMGKTETAYGEALFQALTGYAYDTFGKLNKVNKTTKILQIKNFNIISFFMVYILPRTDNKKY